MIILKTGQLLLCVTFIYFIFQTSDWKPEYHPDLNPRQSDSNIQVRCFPARTHITDHKISVTQGQCSNTADIVVHFPSKFKSYCAISQTLGFGGRSPLVELLFVCFCAKIQITQWHALIIGTREMKCAIYSLQSSREGEWRLN